jgi:hypothetical protein
MRPSPLARLLIVDDESAQVEALCRRVVAEPHDTAPPTTGCDKCGLVCEEMRATCR